MRAATKEEQRQKPISRPSISMLAAILLLAVGTATPAFASTTSAPLSENSRHGVSAASGDLASAPIRAKSNTASDFEPGLRRDRVGFPPWPKGASGLQSPSLGAARVGDPAIQSERAYVSGFREIRKKAKAARAGDASAAAEIRAAKALREEGLNVHFRKAAGDQRGIRNVRTSDFLVGGEAGTGAGGIPYEVFSPVRGTSPGSIARTLRDKLHQADRFILDLTRNGLAPSDFSNIVYRINRMPKIPRRAQEVLFLQDEAIVGSTH